MKYAEELEAHKIHEHLYKMGDVTLEIGTSIWITIPSPHTTSYTITIKKQPSVAPHLFNIFKTYATTHAILKNVHHPSLRWGHSDNTPTLFLIAKDETKNTLVHVHADTIYVVGNFEYQQQTTKHNLSDPQVFEKALQAIQTHACKPTSYTF